jgi:DNA-binding transcriptional LysR family regulator
MPNDTISIIRSGLDYALARQRLAQLASNRVGPADSREIDALREAVAHWESVCCLPSSQVRAQSLRPMAKVA